jgi:DHA1 family bicyclomycin/chloramphenicol resistance-like MFS transporter
VISHERMWKRWRRKPAAEGALMSDYAPQEAEAAALTLRAKPESAAAERRSLGTLAILSALMAFGPISTDLYLPALPSMADSLHTDAGVMEWTISGYLIGFSLGQLLWGPIGDRYGRRGPVALGIVLFIVGSAGCALSTTASGMIAWRLVQAVGACAGVVLARAMVRDLYTGPRAAQMLSSLIVVMAIAPLIGPIVGAQVLRFASWPWIFWLLVAIGVAALLALLTLPETLPRERRRRDKLSNSLRAYYRLLGDVRVMGFAMAGSALYFGVFAYVAGSAFAYIDYYKLSPQTYAIVFGAGILGIMATNLINARQVIRWGLVTPLRLGATFAALSGLWAAYAAFTGFGGLVGLVAPLFVFTAMNGLVIANSIGGAMANYPRRAGTVSALVGALQYGAGVAGSGLLGAFADGTPRPLGAVIALAGLAAAACAWLLVKRHMR